MRQMEFNRIIVLLSTLIFLAVPVFSYTDTLLINVDIITGSRVPISEAYVGDTFHYNISLMNVGNETIRANFTVEVYNPSSEKLNTRKFSKTIEPNVTEYLFPTRNRSFEYLGKLYKEEYDVIRFDTAGAYKLSIESDYPLIFLHERLTESTYDEVRYAEYFDVMPKWQRDWIAESSNWQRVSNETLTATADFSEKILHSSNKIEGFTLAVLVLTAMLVVSELYNHKLINLTLFLVTLIVFSILFTILTVTTVY